jgi:hypothetical protein
VKLQPHAAATGTPTIVSTPNTFTPGTKLTVSRVGYPASGITYSYYWERSSDGGTTWAKAGTASSYTVLPGDAGKLVRVRLTAKRAGWSTSTIISAPQSIAFSTLTPTSPFTIAAAKVDQTLSAATTTWNTTGVALTYQWERNGVPIPGATSATIVPTASWFGDELQAKVTASKAGYQPVTVVSNLVRVAEGNAPTSTALTISPTNPVAGSPVIVSSGVWSVAGVTLTYEWRRAEDDSVVATTATATLEPGTYVVTVTAARDGYLPGRVSKTVTVP